MAQKAVSFGDLYAKSLQKNAKRSIRRSDTPAGASTPGYRPLVPPSTPYDTETTLPPSTSPTTEDEETPQPRKTNIYSIEEEGSTSIGDSPDETFEDTSMSSSDKGSEDEESFPDLDDTSANVPNSVPGPAVPEPAEISAEAPSKPAPLAQPAAAPPPAQSDAPPPLAQPAAAPPPAQSDAPPPLAQPAAAPPPAQSDAPPPLAQPAAASPPAQPIDEPPVQTSKPTSALLPMEMPSGDVTPFTAEDRLRALGVTYPKVPGANTLPDGRTIVVTQRQSVSLHEVSQACKDVIDSPEFMQAVSAARASVRSVMEEQSSSALDDLKQRLEALSSEKLEECDPVTSADARTALADLTAWTQAQTKLAAAAAAVSRTQKAVELAEAAASAAREEQQRQQQAATRTQQTSGAALSQLLPRLYKSLKKWEAVAASKP